jgi:hypothetical protein
MKDLIAEEEEAGRLEDERAAARAAADKEKRAKKNAKKKVRPGLMSECVSESPGRAPMSARAGTWCMMYGPDAFVSVG